METPTAGPGSKRLNLPRIVIAGTHSGVGKTSVAVALVAALRRHGLRVQTFKVGPDYLDPTYLATASGRPCFNLDPWMTGLDYARQLFCAEASSADISVVEGVMGLFDGVDALSPDGSTAQVARLLEAPVALVLDAHGLARSAAALALGFSSFDPDLRWAGFFANRVGSFAHGAMIGAALRNRGLPELLGAFDVGAFPDLPSRHLGLVAANARTLPSGVVDALATALERVVDISKVVTLASDAAPLTTSESENSAPSPACVRVGIAQDDAFGFYYPDNLRALERSGGELIPFSPLSDDDLPEQLDALYLGGGYPELHAQPLAANQRMLNAVRTFADSGRPVYAECGGLMYLARSLETMDGRIHELAGVLPGRTKMHKHRMVLGYVEIRLTRDSLWGMRGQSFRGHEFHYSELMDDPTHRSPWENVYGSERPARTAPAALGFQHGKRLVSYVHLHFASRPSSAQRFVEICLGCRQAAAPGS